MKKNRFIIETPLSVLLASLVQFTFYAIFIIFLTAIVSALLINSDDPISHINVSSNIILLFSVLICSFFFTKIIKAPEICSLISGLILCAILLFCSAFVQRQGTPSPLTITLVYISIPIIAYFSALGANKSARKNKIPNIKLKRYRK